MNVTETLYLTTWLENWGTGTKRIIEACREQGVEEPTWCRAGGFVYVTFKRPTKHRSSTAQVPPKHDPSTTQVENLGGDSAPSTPQARPKFAPSSPQVIQLVQTMGTGDYTIRELAEMCGYQDPKHFREGYIKPALDEGALERLFPDQPNHPKQKYRLTATALEWKNSQHQN